MTFNNAHHFLQPDWPAPKQIKAYTTLRQSGIGHNPAFDPAALAADAAILQSVLHLPQAPIWLQQIHGNQVLPALPENLHQPADAAFSQTAQQVCIIRTADCLPILFTNEQGTVVAAAHAGWRGLASGIIAATVAALPTPPQNLLVWLGPGISANFFTVRRDVYETFTQANPANEQAFKAIATDQWQADLYQLARLQLQALGINQIFGGECCTYSDPERFFSYRRDGNMTGRIISLIWIDHSDSMQ